jgi:hypothetical protein
MGNETGRPITPDTNDACPIGIGTLRARLEQKFQLFFFMPNMQVEGINEDGKALPRPTSGADPTSQADPTDHWDR